MAKKASTRKPVLSDHKRIGTRFIPPLLQLSSFEFISWVDCTLPELIWIGLLEYSLGLKKASELAILLAQTSIEVSEQSKKRWYAPATAYSLLSEKQQIEIVKKLEVTRSLHSIKTALTTLITLYPECPLKFLFQGEEEQFRREKYSIDEFKGFLNDYMYKYDRIATLAQANAIYIAFVTDMLKVVKGVSGLENFPDIAEFPNTEESRRVAASLYPTINSFMDVFLKENSFAQYTPWSRYFWNRGLQLDPCTMREITKSYE